jgi:hypothetical protein
MPGKTMGRRPHKRFSGWVRTDTGWRRVYSADDPKEVGLMLNKATKYRAGVGTMILERGQHPLMVQRKGS